jgi:hypothetical protein
MTIEQVQAKLARVRVHFHAISLHADILSTGEFTDHAWELACAIDELDRELSGETTDVYLDDPEDWVETDSPATELHGTEDN